MLAGRTFTMHDAEKAPIVAVVNREFARKLFGSVDKAVGQHFKFWGGQRAEVIGVVEDGKYQTLTEDQKPAMFFSFLQHKGSDVWILVRSERDPQEIGAACNARCAVSIPRCRSRSKRGTANWTRPSLQPASPLWLSAFWACLARCSPLPEYLAWLLTR